MEIQVENPVKYKNFWWLKEIIELVVDHIEPKQEIHLILTDSITKTRKEIFPPTVKKVGMGGIIEEVTRADAEPPYWAGALKKEDIIVFAKPFDIIRDSLTYENVTAGFAHEISECEIYKRQSNLWFEFDREQLDLLESWNPEHELVVKLIRVSIRDRLADKFAAEKGFQREILSIPPSTLKGLTSFISQAEEVPYPVIAFQMIAFDKSLSLEKAGFPTLATSWLDWLQSKTTRISKQTTPFFDYYREFRKQVSSTGLTSSSLLSVYNRELFINRSA